MEARKSQQCGDGEHSYTAGSKSFNKHRHEMAEKNDGIMPSIPELIKHTHTWFDGKYVDKYAENIVQEVYSLAPQMLVSEGTDLDSDNTNFREAEQVFHQRVPVIKGYQFGLGSIQYHNGQTSKSFTPCQTNFT